MNKIRRIIIGIAAVSALGLTSLFAHSGENRWVRVINHASSPIRYLYVSNVDQRNWGRDILGDFQVISTGYYMDFNIDDGSGHCLYDFKAVLYDGRVAETDNLNVCTNGSWTVNDSN